MKFFGTLILLLLFNIVPFAQCESLSMSLITNEPTCYGFSDGSITVNPLGGEGGYIIEIRNEDGDLLNAGGSNTANSLIEAWYYLKVTDMIDCVLLDSVYLDAPGIIEVETTLEYCSDFCDGSIVVDTVSNYSGDFDLISYYWSPNPTGENGIGQNELLELCGGEYNLTVNDENGCSRVFTFMMDCFGGVEDLESEKWNVFYDDKLNSLSILNVDKTENTFLEIIDVRGKIILNTSLNGGDNSINIDFNSGLYVYIIKNNERLLATGKLLVNN